MKSIYFFILNQNIDLQKLLSTKVKQNNKDIFISENQNIDLIH